MPHSYTHFLLGREGWWYVVVDFYTILNEEEGGARWKRERERVGVNMTLSDMFD